MSDMPRRMGKYELQERLGRGGMAEVWKARDTRLRRPVAIKFLHADLAADPDFVARFLREAQLIAALRHPNIVQVFDFHLTEHPGSDTSAAPAQTSASPQSTDATAYMVMEYVQGQTLAQYLGETSHKGRFPSFEALVRLFTPVTLAVDYAHQQGTIHRDIKPANILLDQTRTARNPMGEPILSDFGLARLLSGATQTVAGIVMGTPLYMAPEQVQNMTTTSRSDLYSLGVVLYEALTGTAPFHGDSPSSVMMQHVTATPAAPDSVNPQLPPEVTPVLLKSLAKDPAERFSSASAMTLALCDALGVVAPEDLRAAVAAQHAPDSSSEAAADVNVPVLEATAGDALATPVSPSGDDARAVADSTVLAGPDEPRSASRAQPGNGLASAATILTRKASSASAAASGVANSFGAGVRRAITIAPREDIPGGNNQIPPKRLARVGPLTVRWVVLAVVLIAIIGSGAWAIVAHRAGAPTVVSVAPVGQAFFMSSGQVSLDGNQGANDEVQINLTGIPAPPTGKSYFGWLLPDLNQSEAPDILLGKLSVSHGAIHFLYRGDSQHTNLLATASRFLVTTEASNVTPQIPTPDLSAWRYFAQLPQTPAPGQQYSLVDHLRHLLAKDPVLDSLHLPGGLTIWAFRNTRQVFQWALSAQTEWNAGHFATVHRQVVAILDDVDGSGEVSRDVPPGTPLFTNLRMAQVGLLELDPGKQNPEAYMYHIALHLNGVLQSPGATPAQRSEATRINSALSNVNTWLGHVRKDATQLAAMSDSQLAQPASLALINDMVTQATYAYQGTNDPATGQQQDGMSQLYQEVQKLAAFTVKPYHS